MILKKLVLTSFGKFNNNTINLENGINVIFGHNEAGKTTIHKFIEGMLYGFFKPYSKRKLYSEDYDKYLPWAQNDFYGVLKYSSRNIDYRVERNFMKGYDEVKIFEDETGENLTHMFEYDSALRVANPTSLHLGLNSVVFNNTISIKQLGSQTEADLSKEVKDSLINLGGSLDEDISVKKVIDKLDGKIDSIGTKGRIKTSPYGKVIKDLDELIVEEEKAQRLYNEIKELQIVVNEINKEVGILKNHKNEISKKIQLVEGYNISKRYKEAVKILGDIEELVSRIKELESYSQLNSDDYSKAIAENSKLTSIKNILDDIKDKYGILRDGLQELENELTRLANFDGIQIDEVEEVVGMFSRMEEKKKEVANYHIKVKELEEKIRTVDQQELYTINEDIYEYEKLEVEKNNLLYDKEYTNRSYLKSRLEEKEDQHKKINSFKAISVFLMIPALAVGYFTSPILYALVSIPILMLLYSVFSTKELNKYINRLKQQIIDGDTSEIQRKSKMDLKDREMKEIFKRHSCTSKAELMIKANEYSADYALNKDKKDSLLEHQGMISQIQEEIDKYQAIISKCLAYMGKDCEMSLVNVKRFKEEYNKYTRLSEAKIRTEKDIKVLIAEGEKQQTRFDETKRIFEGILTNNNVRDLDEFKEGLEKRKEYEKLLVQKENQEDLNNKVLGDDSIETLKEKTMEYGDINIDNVPKIEIQQLKLELEKTNDDIRSNLEEFSKLEERINNFSSATRPLVEIREEIIRKNELKDEYANKLESLNLAKEAINKISKGIQRDFAPELNKKVGSIINIITNGKYSDVKITENLDIKVIDSSRERVVEIDRLSGGTVDQLYFATRLGIIDIIKGNSNFPIILDDCFTQYDIKRLTSILSYLSKEGLKRQILLFTCHKREKEILDRANVQYNYIEI